MNHNSQQITSNLPKERENSRIQGAIAFGFASHWLKNWRDSFKPITKRGKRNRALILNATLNLPPQGLV